MKEYKNIEIKTNKIPLTGLGQWVITISGDDWAKILTNSEKNLKNNLQIPGFRKGKVPPHIAKKHIADADILKDASHSAIKIAYQYGLDQKDLDVKVTNKPSVEVNDISKDSCQLTFNFDLPLEVNLKEYSNLNIKKPEIHVSKEEIAEQVKLLKDRFAVYSPKEGPLAEGDIAIFDFEGTIDGQEFPGNKSDNTQLEIGSKQFIAGFEEQMIGMKAEATKTFPVTFPQDYHVENLAGKEAQFTIHLKEVKTKLVNEDNEELVKDVNIPNVTTYQELLTYIEKQIEVQKMNVAREEFLNTIFTEILKTATVIIPNSLIDKETERLLSDFKAQLKHQNVTFEDYQKLTNLSEKDIKEEAQKDAIRQLQTYIIVEEVAQTQKISATDDEIEAYLKQLSAQFNIPIEEIKKNMQDFALVVNNIRRSKTLDWLWENNGSSDAVEQDQPELKAEEDSSAKKN